MELYARRIYLVVFLRRFSLHFAPHVLAVCLPTNTTSIRAMQSFLADQGTQRLNP